MVLPVTRGVLLVTGISFLIPRLRLVARWGAVGILVASLFPDAITEVREPERMRELGVPPKVALARIGLQGALIALVWGSTHPQPN